MNCGATFSPDRKYRYTLFREWNPKQPTVAFVGLNPSKADEIRDDATVTRCIRRAATLGYGRYEMLNLFAWRSTDWAVLIQRHRVPDPVGPENNNAIYEVAKRVNAIICAWGNHGKIDGRGDYVLSILRSTGTPLYALRITKLGIPEHALYLPYSLQPVELK